RFGTRVSYRIRLGRGSITFGGRSRFKAFFGRFGVVQGSRRWARFRAFGGLDGWFRGQFGRFHTLERGQFAGFHDHVRGRLGSREGFLAGGQYRGLELAVVGVDGLLDALDYLGVDALDLLELLRGHAAQLFDGADAGFHQRFEHLFRQSVVQQDG